MWKLYEIFKVLKIKKRIVSTENIRGNTVIVSFDKETLGNLGLSLNRTRQISKLRLGRGMFCSLSHRGPYITRILELGKTCNTQNSCKWDSNNLLNTNSHTYT